MSYGVHERHYLERAKSRLLEDTPEALFYAAFELRCFLEARQDHYLDAQRQYTKSVPEAAWKLSSQGKSLRAIYKEERIQQIVWAFSEERQLLLHHVPVTNRLRQLVGQLDTYRHAQSQYRDPEDEWWAVFRGRLVEVYRLAWVVLQGNLPSPALISRKGGKVIGNLIVEFDEKPDDLDLSSFVGAITMAHFSFLDQPPAEWVCDLPA